MSIGLAVGLIVVVATADCSANRAFPVIAGVMLLVTLTFYACTLIADFGFVTFVVFEALCLSIALAAYWRLATRGNRGALLLALGIALTMTAALIQASKAVSMTLGSWPLDHNGVFHLVQMPAIILIAIGVRWFDLCDVCMAAADEVTSGIELRADDFHDHKHGADDTAEANSRNADSKRHGGTVCGFQSGQNNEGTEDRHGQ